MSLESLDRNCFADRGKASAFEDRAAGDDRSCRRSSDSPLRILVIDDSESILTVLKQGLTCFGQEVFAAAGGEEGLKIFRSDSIDAIVCDFAMPDMNGLQVSEQIRTTCRRREVPKTPFILLTGWGEEMEPADRTSESGIDRVLEKPIDLGDLMATIREMCDRDAESVLTPI